MTKTQKLLLKISGAASLTLAVAIGIMTFANAPVADAAGFEDVRGTKRYIIDSPYKNVNWDTWKSYKTATHVHTNMSDGDIPFDEMIEHYYSAGFDCLAITDHGTVNYGWTAKKSRHFYYSVINIGKGTPNLSAARNTEITTGVGRNGQKMIDIPLGIELNGASTKKVHVNGWFADAGDGDMEETSSGVKGVVTAVKKNHNANGLTHVNHVGEWSGGNDGISAYDATFVSDFANVYKSYSSCIGMELVNTSDGRTKNDRYLYDQVLKVLAPVGRTIFGFCEDDSHDTGDLDRNAQYLWMPDNTVANVKACLQSGAFFASSKNSKGADELNGVTGSGDYPTVSRITTDDIHSQITFNVAKATRACIVANGTLVDTITCNTNGDTVVFDLNKYEANIGSYVRIYFTGAGGITYVQPFYVTSVPYQTKTVTINTNAIDANIGVKNASGSLIARDSYTRISATYVFDTEGTYTYSVSCDGYYTKTGTFSVTTADLSSTTTVEINAELESVPSLIINGSDGSSTINNSNPGNENYTQYLIDGLHEGVTAEELAALAQSSNTTGEITVIPSPNGYGTGTKIALKVGDEIAESVTVVIYGDVDGNGIVDACDANVISAKIYNMPLSKAATAACDVNNDGVFDSRDINALKDFGLSPGSSLSIVQSRSNDQSNDTITV